MSEQLDLFDPSENESLKAYIAQQLADFDSIWPGDKTNDR